MSLFLNPLRALKRIFNRKPSTPVTKLAGTSPQAQPADDAPRHQIALSKFFGREEELQWLRGHFEEVANVDEDGKSRPGPRLAVIVADTGVGKSRIVQELYHQLTVSSRWDPAECNYWPDAFQRPGRDSLRVNPEFPESHVPGGPPLFLWLGMRWEDPDQRNEVATKCPIAEASATLDRHIQLVNRHSSIWNAAKEAGLNAIANISVAEAVAAALDHVTGLPFQTAFEGIQKAKEAKSKRSRVGSPGEEAKIERSSAADRFCECLARIMRGRHRIPVVLWLDDAQWIDPDTCRLVQEIMARATQLRWPLLIVATHWEREWNQHQSDGRSRSDSISAWQDDPRASVRTLQLATDAPMRSRLLAALPGLTSIQADVILEKAAGNFLSLDEIIGHALLSTRNFEGRDTSAALVAAEEQTIRSWPIDRERRIKKMFATLDEDVRDILGWGSHVGRRFLASVVSEFGASEVEGCARSRMAECADPLAVLSEPNPLVREFRDRAFFVAAQEYFAGKLAPAYRARLEQSLRSHLTEWINASFDGEGDLLAPPGEGNPSERLAEAPADSVGALMAGERMDLLSMAVRWLPLPAETDWSAAQDQAALRAAVWIVGRAANEGLWDLARHEGVRLAPIDWTEVPASIVSTGYRWDKASQLEDAGAHMEAYTIVESVLALEQQAAANAFDLKIVRDQVWSRLRLAGIDAKLGRHAKRWTHCLQAETLVKDLIEGGHDGNDEYELLGKVVIELADCLVSSGEHAEALSRYEESLAIARQLAADVGTPAYRRDVSYTLDKIGDVLQGQGEHAEALSRYEESLEIARQLVAEGMAGDLLAAMLIAVSAAEAASDAGMRDRCTHPLDVMIEALSGLVTNAVAEGDLGHAGDLIAAAAPMLLKHGQTGVILERCAELEAGYMGVASGPVERDVLLANATCLLFRAAASAVEGDEQAAAAVWMECLDAERKIVELTDADEVHAYIEDAVKKPMEDCIACLDASGHQSMADDWRRDLQAFVVSYEATGD
ncbi:MAG: tetratricopeptide repeat protein, partial [Phycisphaerales bacterium]|nr:tetratricopeptide repeat protein [Phycisphaerales bacterium]